MQGGVRRHPVWSEVGDRLTEVGAQVAYLWPDVELNDLAQVRDEHDLYVLKSGSPVGLSFAGALHAAGAAILNPYPVAAMCRDKIVTSHVLAAGGVPVPATWVTEDRDHLGALLNRGPIVVKPYRGSRGMGVVVVRDEAELGALEPDAGPLFVQRYHAPDGDGLDYKMYVIGGEVFGIRRVWPARTYEDKLGQAFDPGAEMRTIAELCSAAIGVDTFGFDIVYSDGVPYVVDLSGFPGFKGVPGATTRLADAIAAAARRARRGEAVTEGMR
jgi:ribosomal protein S6--L-glutamate ligase